MTQALHPSRCQWAYSSQKHLATYLEYHDNEWGVPCFDEQQLIELLLLEMQQAGLSWITVLVKRDHFRRAFDGFDIDKIVLYDEQKVALLLNDAGIIRNRLKINAVINNCREIRKIQQQYGSFSAYIWSFVDGCPIQNMLSDGMDFPVSSVVSDSISKDLKSRGCTFVGTVIIYSFLQAAGLINDHRVECFRHSYCLNYCS